MPLSSGVSVFLGSYLRAGNILVLKYTREQQVENKR